MQELIACVDHIKFDLEIAVEQQLGAQPLPFPGMDSKLNDIVILKYDGSQYHTCICIYFTESGAAVCEFFMRAACMKGK